MKKLTAVTGMLVLMAGCIWAQAETGQITGTVTDPTGAAVPGARVTVRSAATGSVRTVDTSPEGTYTVTNLLPAEYRIAVEAAGFTKVERRVVLTVGTRLGQDIRL